MVAWLLKLLLISLNLRSSFKSLRPARRKQRTDARSGVQARESRTERTRRKQVREEVANWVVLVCVFMLERLADKTVAWVVPLYGTLKASVFVMVLCGRGQGSTYVFDKVIKPVVRPYERPLDLVGFVLGEVLDILLAALLFFPKWVGTKVKERRKEPDVPSILRGLRQLSQPRLAQSLADSIERSQGDSDAISARLSQPLQVKVNPVPFRPQRPQPARPAKPPAAATTAAPEPPPARPAPANDDIPRPPASSTAPFRPVPVVPAASTSKLPAAARPPNRAAQAALPGPSRLPIPRTAGPPPTVASTSSSSSSSLYPSLAGLSAPLPPTPQHVVSSSTAAVQTLAGADAPVPAPAPAPAPRTARSKGKARAREAEEAPAAAAAPAPKRARTSRRSTRAAEEEDGGVERAASLVERTPSPGPAAGTEAAQQQVPPTPAPPGAFAFGLAAAGQDERPGEADDELMEPLTELPEAEAAAEEQPTPRRRSTRKSAASATASAPPSQPATSATKATKRARTTAAAAAAAVETDEGSTPAATPPRKKRAHLNASTSTSIGAPVEAGAATPRARALGAIAQLSHDLLGDDGMADGPPRKTGSGKGVLARSVRGRTGAVAGGGVAKSTRATRRTTIESEEEDEEDHGRTASPRRRKATTLRSVSARDSDPSEEHERAKKAPTHGRERARVAAAGTKPRAGGVRVARAPSADPAPAASLSRSRSRSAASAAQDEPARAAPPPPQRRARRVQLGRAGAAMPEDEEDEVDGVPVVRRRAAGTGTGTRGRAGR